MAVQAAVGVLVCGTHHAGVPNPMLQRRAENGVILNGTKDLGRVPTHVKEPSCFTAFIMPHAPAWAWCLWRR